MPRPVVVGLIADPGLPQQVADRLAQDLGEHLGRRLDGSVDWRIEVSGHTLPLTDAGEIPLAERAPHLLARHGWDAVVYLTDLPRRHDAAPILAELSSESRGILISLPALGAWRVTDRTRALLVPLLASLGDGSDTTRAADRAVGGPIARRTVAGGLQLLIRPGRLNNLRLLAGMVRNNQLGTLLPALSSTGAAGVGTGAFGIFYASIWTMADSLPPARLALVSAAVITALSSWLIFYNGLWVTDRGVVGGRSPRAWLDNAATILTVGLSVALMYALLYALLLSAALLIITPDYLASELHRPVSIADHLKLSWLAASLGTMGGAIGSNFDSDRAIAAATYSRRVYERRQLARDEDDA